jgi:hypothetical protein
MIVDRTGAVSLFPSELGIHGTTRFSYRKEELARNHFTALAKLSILFFGQIEPHAAATDVDPVSNRLLGFKVENRTAASGKFHDHDQAQKCELLRQRCFEILFEELKVASVPEHEAHVDPRHWDSIGQEMANISVEKIVK